MKTARTPTPWAAHEHYVNDEPMTVVSDSETWQSLRLPIAHHGKIVGQLEMSTATGGFPQVDTESECRANLEFVLRAVNAHDDLVSALRTCKEVLRAVKTESGLHYPHAEDAIKAALTKAQS